MKSLKVFNHSSCLWAALRPRLWRIGLLCALTFVQAVLQVGMAVIFRYVIDAVLGGGNTVLWTILLLTDLLAQVGIHALYSWYTASTADHFTVSLRRRLLQSAVNSLDVRLEQFHSGQLLSRGMEDVRTLCDGLVQALPALVGQIARLVAAFAAVLLIYPGLAGILLVAGGVVIVGVATLRPVLRKKQKAVRKADERVMATMQEDLQQLELIQSLDVQEQILHRFGKRQKKSLSARFHQRLWSVGSNGVVNTVSMAGTGALLLWGTAKVAEGVLSYGALTSLIQLLNQFRTPVLSLSGLWNRFVSVEVSVERLSVLLDVPVTQKKQTRIVNPAAVVFENVTFCYSGEETPVVENFSLRLPLEGWTCLSGFSGRGKSTLFKLILGLYKPQTGRVYLETSEGEILCDENTRHLFAYVPQDYALFSGTVLENLLLVAPDADETTRRKALELVRADFVFDMTEAENTTLRENNTGLSKGQIQRLAIARAILMDRPILLLDECTSALDAETENAVLRNLRALDKGAILVTHRPEALEVLDGVIAISMEE
ncbi:MAG: ABC transporter ATP-binding protein [Oscillospiraceae bacterium]|nr:ABC transporter ATP-binding protein [Oscillospiraceae bacterium]